MEREYSIEALAAWNNLRSLLNLAALADRLGIHRSSPSQWRVVPANRVDAISDITGIPAHRLRPDKYPPPSKAAMPWQI